MLSVNINNMKINKRGYTLTIVSWKKVAYLSRQSNKYIFYLQRVMTMGCSIYDCTFREAVHNLKICKQKGLDIHKLKEESFEGERWWKLIPVPASQESTSPLSFEKRA